jgi:hypothetical protein
MLDEHRSGVLGNGVVGFNIMRDIVCIDIVRYFEPQGAIHVLNSVGRNDILVYVLSNRLRS